MSESTSSAQPYLRALPSNDKPEELRRSITELVMAANYSVQTHKATTERFKAVGGEMDTFRERLEALEKLVNKAVSVVTRMEQTRVVEQQSTKRYMAYFGGGIALLNLLFVVLTFMAHSGH